MGSSVFSPLVAQWFAEQLGEPTEAQREAWPAAARGDHVLIAAPTGSGKTLAAFLVAIDQLVREAEQGRGLPDETRVVYVSPLKALSHDIELNLRAPLAQMAERSRAQGRDFPELRVWARTGDTRSHDRVKAAQRPPHIVVTTPESLYVLLTSAGGRRMLSAVRTVIVDEIHALVRDKRGSHLALSLERLEALLPGRPRLQRVGLSATQKPIARVAEFLAGAAPAPVHVVDVGHRRELDLALHVPEAPLEAVMSHQVWGELYAKLVELISEHRTTLVFANTRRAVERIARQLSERLGPERVGAHHGSLSRDKRLSAERRLKQGELSVLVATASLELGIDIGHVDLVCQLGSPRSIAGFVQRVGRSGHSLAGTPKGRLFPLSRDDLVECVALLRAVRGGELDRVQIPQQPLDVLAQQIVAEVSAAEWGHEALFSLVRRARPFAELTRADFAAVVRMLAEGFSTQRGRRAALIHHDAVNGRLKGRRGASIVALTSGGAIPDSFDYQVLLEPENLPVGTVHEDFAIESTVGDIFQLGNASYRIRKAEPGLLRVEDAHGLPPSLPFWVAEAPGRTDELSRAVSQLRLELVAWLRDLDVDGVVQRTAAHHLLPEPAARQLVDYLAAAQRQLGAMPSQQCIVLERFFDETGSMHLVLHAPFGTRVNRAFGLALRKRFCRSFNVELQAAANDDAIVLSLGPMHSFALEDVFAFLHPGTVRDVLVQAMLPAPLFAVRFRWNAARSLAVPRFRGGKKLAPRLQRMLADDLLAVAFPDQVACAENLAGAREVPDHPLVRQTVQDCLNEAMDIDGLTCLLQRIKRGEVACLARDLTEPSALAAEVLSARPYAFLDDAPLEERRTQAVSQRRVFEPLSARELSALDPAAIERVIDEIKPRCRDADELHDALLVHGALSESDAGGLALQESFEQLRQAGRATRVRCGHATLWVCAERAQLFRLAAPDAVFEVGLREPSLGEPLADTREQAWVELVRGRLELLGPVTATELSSALGLTPDAVTHALSQLELQGFVLRGQFRPGALGVEWCERRLLARIHRATLARLRREIEPVSPAVFVRFLFAHQRLASPLRGPEGLWAVVEQLAGFQLAAGAWERSILPARVADYRPEWLDGLAFSGRAMWARALPSGQERRQGPVRTTPIALYPRSAFASLWTRQDAPFTLTRAAERLLEALRARGASFADELALGCGFDRALVQQGLAELVAHGLVTGDGFMGLRALLAGAGSRERAREGASPAGRFTLLSNAARPDAEAWARVLLDRWGVVFRAVAQREQMGVPWLEVLRALRRMELAGEVRGGRFVAGFAGEQYARPSAVSALRRARREGEACADVTVVGASDPLNVSGTLLPGPKVPVSLDGRIAFRGGLPVASSARGVVTWLDPALAAGERERIEALLSARRAGGGPRVVAARRYAW